MWIFKAKIPFLNYYFNQQKIKINIHRKWINLKVFVKITNQSV